MRMLESVLTYGRMLSTKVKVAIAIAIVKAIDLIRAVRIPIKIASSGNVNHGAMP